MKGPDDDDLTPNALAVTEEDERGKVRIPEQSQAGKLFLSMEGGTLNLNEHLAASAFGSDDDGFIKGIINQVFQLANNGKGELDAAQVEFIAGALVGIKPKDSLEAMLSAQIIANQILTMKFAGQLYRADSFPKQAAIEKVYTKLARTTPALMEALRSKRTGGQQTVKVEHVTVNEGGQAIVGNVNRGGE